MRMARMVKRCYGQRRFTERARFGADVCGWQLRKRLRRIAHHYQRSVLVRRAKEEILKRRLNNSQRPGSSTGPGRLLLPLESAHIARAFKAIRSCRIASRQILVAGRPMPDILRVEHVMIALLLARTRAI